MRNIPPVAVEHAPNSFSTVAVGNEYGVAGELHELASSSEGGE
jgi:hypothetical protein